MPISRGEAVSTAAATLRGELVQFQPKHHFLNFVVDGGRLVFSGGDPDVKTSSPNIYRADPRTGVEELVAQASDPANSVFTLASVDGHLVYAETSQVGDLIYRIHAVVAGKDSVLDQLVLSDSTAQQEQRALVALPMVATDGVDAIWVTGRVRDGRPAYELKAARFDGSDVRSLYGSTEWIGYPRVAGERVFFSRSFSDPAVWNVGRRGSQAAIAYAPGHAEPATFGGYVVTKFGGSGALAPGGISLWTQTGVRTDLVPANALASEPSINERFVTWWGPTDKVWAYDWRTGTKVVLGEALKDASGKTGIVGRQAAYPGVVVWLATIPGDLHDTANVKPYFEFLFLG